MHLNNMIGTGIWARLTISSPSMRRGPKQQQYGACCRMNSGIADIEPPYGPLSLDDGLTDSESVYHKLIKNICERYGKLYTKQLQQQLTGGTDRQICETIVQTLRIPIKPEALELEINKNMPKATLQKGAERLLRHLHKNNIPLALATNATDQAVRLHMASHPKLFGLFHHMVTISDSEVYRGKPYPDIYFVAAARFVAKPKTKECLVFEDSPIGVEAAVSAGMQVVMTPAKNIIHTKQTRKATLVLPSLAHFKPELFGLPPYPISEPGQHKKVLTASKSKIRTQ